MADLEHAAALLLANSLITIGHPYSQAAIEATAFDLCKWCKGRIAEGRIIAPEAQAEDLIAAARLWPEGWPERGGTAKLLALFREQNPAPARVELTVEELIDSQLKQGVLAAPCALCAASEKFCAFGGPRSHALESEWAQSGVPMPNTPKQLVPTPPPSKTPITQADLDALLARGRLNYEEEQCRKKQQLERLGIQ